MNNIDFESIKLAIEFPKKYKIIVDNDDIYMIDVDKMEKDDDSDYTANQFESFGEDFIVELLNRLGATSERC